MVKKIEIKNDSKIKDLCSKYKDSLKEIYSESVFDFNSYEDVLAHIYSFEHIIIMLDKLIEEKENEEIPEKIIKDGKYEYKLVTEIKKTEKVFMNKWQQLNDVGLSSAERKELNLSYKDYLKLKYAKYKGFIDMVSDMIESGTIYYSN